MSLLTALLSAAALNAAPALAGGPDAHPQAGAQGRYHVQTIEHRFEQDTRHQRRYRAAARAGSDGAPSPRTVQLSPDFFYGPLTGGVERPPVLLYPVRHGYVIHGAPSGPVSAGQAAAARGLGQGGSQ